MLTGVILAGGENRRMGGRMKALLSFGRESILERQMAMMKTVCQELIIVTNQPDLFSHLDGDHDVQIITDKMPGKGPLAGIHAAAVHTRHDHLWVVACDMPYISPGAAKILLSGQREKNHDAAVPIVDGRIQPLHAVYTRRTLPILEDVLQAGEYKVQAFLDKINWLPVQEDLFLSKKIGSRFIMNLNTPEEYEQALKIDKQDN